MSEFDLAYENPVVVVLSSSNEFAKYLAVCIQSIVDTSSSEYDYDIVVLERSISEKNKKRILEEGKGRRNISIRFFNVKKVAAKYNFFLNSSRLSEETYYGLLVPYILSSFKKAIIMDCDMIVKRNIAELFWEDLEGKVVAGVKDIVLAGWLNDRKGKDTYTYYKEYLNVDDPYLFFNGGLLVVDFVKFREIATKEKISKYINEYKLRVVDQDVFNIIFEGKSKLLDCRWNHMIYVDGAISEAIEDAPKEMQTEYFNAQKNPYIIHYAGDIKPWNFPEVDFADDFWKEARKTLFYESILYSMLDKVSRDIVCSHQAIFHTSILRKLISPYREEKIKRFVKVYLKKDSLLYSAIRRLYFSITNRPYTK